MPEHSAGPGDGLIRAGVVVTALGMLLTLVAMLPLVTDLELPSAFWWLAMLVGVGLFMILVGLARNGRRRSRAQKSARASVD
jgi:peptidoglycan/LPS O-acetylase OafA/YrhL